MDVKNLLKKTGEFLGEEYYGSTYSIGDVRRMRARVSRQGHNWLTFEGSDLRPSTVTELRELGYKVVFVGEQTIVSW